MTAVPRDPITDRLDAALERAFARRWEIRAIYLDEEDRAALDQWATERWGTGAQVFALGYRGGLIVGRKVKGIEIRAGSASRIYSRNGCEVTIPKRLSERVRYRNPTDG